MTGYARQWGAGPDPALLLHCSLAHSGAWEGLARTLSDRLTLTAPDLVGHGRGPAGDPAKDYHDHCTEVALALLPPQPNHVVGHSFGATVALRLAIEHPDRVASLVLIEPVLFAAAAGRPSALAEGAAMTGLDDHLAAGDTMAAARIFLSYWGGGTPLEAMAPQQQRYMADRMWVIGQSGPILHGDSASLLPRLGQVACPVLLMEGAQSPPVIADIQSRLAADIPATQRIIVDGASHMLPITHPKTVAQHIAGFFETAT